MTDSAALFSATLAATWLPDTEIVLLVVSPPIAPIVPVEPLRLVDSAPAPNCTSPAAAAMVTVPVETDWSAALACELFSPTPPAKAGPEAMPAASALLLPVALAVTALPSTWKVLLVGPEPLWFQPATKLLIPDRASAPTSVPVSGEVAPPEVPGSNRLVWLLVSVTGPALVSV